MSLRSPPSGAPLHPRPSNGVSSSPAASAPSASRQLVTFAMQGGAGDGGAMHATSGAGALPSVGVSGRGFAGAAAGRGAAGQSSKASEPLVRGALPLAASSPPPPHPRRSMSPEAAALSSPSLPPSMGAGSPPARRLGAARSSSHKKSTEFPPSSSAAAASAAASPSSVAVAAASSPSGASVKRPSVLVTRSSSSSNSKRTQHARNRSVRISEPEREGTGVHRSGGGGGNGGGGSSGIVQHHQQGHLIQRQSGPTIVPPLVDPLTTPLVVLASLNGAWLASLDVSAQIERDRQPLPGLATLETTARGLVLSAGEEGWKVWNPTAPLSMEEKDHRRQMARESSNGGGPGGSPKARGMMTAGNKYDSEGRLVEDEHDRARVLRIVHASKASSAAAGAPTSPSSASASAASPSSAAAATPVPLTAATFLSDGRLVTTDRAGWLRLYANEQHRWRLLCEQELCAEGDSPADQRNSYSSAAARPVAHLVALEDGRLLIAQDALLSLYDEVLQTSPNAPAFRLDKCFKYTPSSEGVSNALLLSTPGTGSLSLSGSSSAREGSSSSSATLASGKEAQHIRCMLSLPSLGSRGLLVTGHDDRSIQILDIHSFTLRSALQGHLGSVSCLTETNDNRLASGSSDSNIKIWSGLDTSAGSRCDLTLRGHTGPIVALLSTWVSNQILSSSADGTLKVWNLSSGACERTWALEAQVERLVLLPVSPASREAGEVWSSETDAEMAAIADIIRAERGPGVESSPQGIAPLPPGAFSHLAMQQVSFPSLDDDNGGAKAGGEEEEKKPEEDEYADEWTQEAGDVAASPTAAARIRPVVAPPTSAAAAASPSLPSPKQQQQQRHPSPSPPPSLYSSRLAPVDKSLFAVRSTPPAVFDLDAEGIKTKDALIRAQAAPHFQTPPPVASRSIVATTKELDSDLGPSAASAAVASPANRIAASSTLFPASSPFNTRAHDRSPSTVPLGNPGIAAPAEGSSRSSSPLRKNMFDRSSAVERARMNAALVGESVLHPSGGDDGSPVRNATSRIPPALLAAQSVDYSPLLVHVSPAKSSNVSGASASPSGPAPVIGAFADFSPEQLTHIIHEKHRRERHERVSLSSRVSALQRTRAGGKFSPLGAPAAAEGDDSPTRGGGERKLAMARANRDPRLPILAHHASPSPSHLSLAAMIAPHHERGSSTASGGLGGEPLSPKSRADRALRQSESAERLFSRTGDGRREALQSMEDSRLRAEAEAEAIARRKARRAAQKQAASRQLSDMISRVAGTKVHVIAQGRADVVAAAAAQKKQLQHQQGGNKGSSQHVLHHPPPSRSQSAAALLQSSSSKSATARSKVFLTALADEKENGDAPSDASDPNQTAAAAGVDEAEEQSKPEGCNGGPSRGSMRRSASTAAVRGGAKGSTSSGNLTRSASESRYSVGGVALSPPPKGTSFNRALYGHLLHAKPNPKTGGLDLGRERWKGRLGVYTHVPASKDSTDPLLAHSPLRHPARGITGPYSSSAIAAAKVISPATNAFVRRMEADAVARRDKSPSERVRERTPSPARAAAGLGSTAPLPSSSSPSHAAAAAAPAGGGPFVPVIDPSIPLRKRVELNAAARSQAAAARAQARQAEKDEAERVTREHWARRAKEAQERAVHRKPAGNFHHRTSELIQQRLAQAQRAEKTQYQLSDDDPKQPVAEEKEA